MAAAAILNFLPVSLLSFGGLSIVAGDVLNNFVCVREYMADLLSFVKKYKMAAATMMNCYLVTLDHPRSLLHGPIILLKFHFNSFTTFGEMAI